MNTISNCYTASMPYEHFMKRAFGLHRTETKFSNAIMRNLIDAENGENHRFLPKREKQLTSIKKYIGQALQKFTKMNLHEPTKAVIINSIESLQDCQNSDDLLNIIKRVLELTQQ